MGAALRSNSALRWDVRSEGCSLPARCPLLLLIGTGQPLITARQIMLSKFEYDGQLNPSFRRGPFRLPITSITSYLPSSVAPRFVHVSSAGESLIYPPRAHCGGLSQQRYKFQTRSPPRSR